MVQILSTESWPLKRGAGGKRRFARRKDLNYPPTAVGGIIDLTSLEVFRTNPTWSAGVAPLSVYAV